MKVHLFEIIAPCLTPNDNSCCCW